ncbi:MAG: hypothetical protein EOP37_08390 [Rubrivivax sp.]|nr:MAG: hypothetical protein EOP37_08390 [Rubrivivax sp.]
MQLHQSYRNERIASDGDGHQQFQASIDRFRIRQTALDTSVLLKRDIGMTSEILLLNKRGVVIGAKRSFAWRGKLMVRFSIAAWRWIDDVPLGRRRGRDYVNCWMRRAWLSRSLYKR